MGLTQTCIASQKVKKGHKQKKSKLEALDAKASPEVPTKKPKRRRHRESETEQAAPDLLVQLGTVLQLCRREVRPPPCLVPIRWFPIRLMHTTRKKSKRGTSKKSQSSKLSTLRLVPKCLSRSRRLRLEYMKGLKVV